MLKKVTTPILEIEYADFNPEGDRTIVLMHGWPDSPVTWRAVTQHLLAANFRVITPALRGFAGTRFLSPETPRSGQLSALGRDLLDLIDALGLDKPILLGHDWGARSVANACGLRPGVASHLMMISVGYGTNNPKQTLSYQQVRNFWYQWFMATERGAQAVQNDRLAFTRMLWDTWSPPHWFTEDDFLETASAFENPDWADVVLHSYRHRWGNAPGYAEYEADDALLNPAPMMDTPTLVIHGGSDFCTHPDTSAGKESFFRGRYERVVLNGVGHFPQRENPYLLFETIIHFLDHKINP
jgi:pimeloyl-ACP methyl ester carboxylesterase